MRSTGGASAIPKGGVAGESEGDTRSCVIAVSAPPPSFLSTKHHPSPIIHVVDSLRFARQPAIVTSKPAQVVRLSAVRHSNHERRAVAARGAFFHYPASLTTVTLRASAAMKDVNRWPWDAFERETLANLRELIRLDTTNPPGNERIATDFIAAALGRCGIEATVIESAPARASLIARVAGRDRAKPPMML